MIKRCKLRLIMTMIVILNSSFLIISKSYAQRTAVDLNFGWLFHAGSLTDGQNTELNDGQWRTVTVPHDFQIEQEWVAPAADERADNTDVAANIKSRLSSRGFKEMGQGWYRMHLTPADSLKGRRLLLQFDGIMYTADIYLNGQKIGGTDYGYVGFEIDVTDRLKFGQDNVIAVMADTREPNNSRWYTGGGLIRSVRLVATDKELYFDRHPLYITTRDNKYVSINGEFTNRTRKAARTQVKIYGPDGQLVFEGGKNIQRHPMARTVEVPLVDEVTIDNPQLWDVDSPHLYRVVAQLLHDDGSVADEASASFGIRTVEIVANRGLLLNGKKVLLQGYANHHSLGALGAAAYPRAI